MKYLYVVGILFVAATGWCQHAPPTSDPAGEPVPYQMLVVKYAKLYSLHFTLEYDQRDGHIAKHRTMIIVDPGSFKDASEFLEHLRKTMPEVLIVRSTENAAVVHIIDKSLPGDDSYAMNQTTDMDFEGTLGEFYARIAEKTKGRIRRRTVFFSIPTITDTRVPIPAIHAKGQTYRSILSVVPLTDPGVLLWESDYSQFPAGSDPVVDVTLYGPPPTTAPQTTQPAR